MHICYTSYIVTAHCNRAISTVFRIMKILLVLAPGVYEFSLRSVKILSLASVVKFVQKASATH